MTTARFLEVLLFAAYGLVIFGAIGMFLTLLFTGQPS